MNCLKIERIKIQNFKSIRELELNEMDNAVILVGKNNTGKTSILDAILSVSGQYKISSKDFYDLNHNIKIEVTLEITEEDLMLLHRQGRISKYKRFDIWKKEFMTRLPSFQEGRLTFVYEVNKNGTKRYTDGVRKNNMYIPLVFPKIHFIDHERNAEEIQEDILMAQRQESLIGLQENRCIFDRAKQCKTCFQCIGLIEKKTPAELTIMEVARLLEYKLYQLNLNAFAEKVNQCFHKNSGPSLDIQFAVQFAAEEIFRIDTVVINKEREREDILDTMSAGLRSIYILSLLEAYIEEDNRVPCIIMMEDPEIYLHPQLQKAASEVLYRLSKKNQIIFSTHSPTMIFNFTSKQIRQVVLDQDYATSIKTGANISWILNDMGYTANDFMGVNFVFIVEGKQDKNRLPLLLNHYYSEVMGEDGKLLRIAIIATNSCTNIKTYANLKYMNQVYIKDQFLMIRDGDGKDAEQLKAQLCGYYKQREKEDVGSLPRVQERNVLILKYYSFENYFLQPDIMAKIGVIPSEEAFYDILWEKYELYLKKLTSVKNMTQKTGICIRSKEDIKTHMESIRIYVRGHNLFDIFYGKYKKEGEADILKAYIQQASRQCFQDILDAIDRFIYFSGRKTEKLSSK